MNENAIAWQPLEVHPLIAKRIKKRNFCCSQCYDSSGALLQCSRCKITQYCSKQCQRKHYVVHQQGCRMVQNVRDGNNTESDHIQKQQRLGDLVFQVAYRSCDTVERGAFLYELALDHYCKHLEELAIRKREGQVELEETTFLAMYASLYDRVKFLLVALDHWEEFVTVLSDTHTIWDDLSPIAEAKHGSQAIQMAIGLLKMKLIARLRVERERYRLSMVNQTLWQSLCKSDAVPSIISKLILIIQGFAVGPDSLLESQEQQLQRQVSSQWDLWRAVLDRSGQLSEMSAPTLFDGNVKSMRELYCFVQDCFFFDVGVSSILNDLPDFDGDYEYDN